MFGSLQSGKHACNLVTRCGVLHSRHSRALRSYKHKMDSRCSVVVPETSPVAEAEADEQPPPPQHLLTFDNFLPECDALRSHFESRFEDPLKTRGDRFVWDFWHVEGQYSLMRTPAHEFFPRKLSDALEDALIFFGESRLGCRGISPIWLSYYIDGCRQELHTDSPHGPWAFVLSLTPGTPGHRAFTGGETLILQPWLLNYWASFDPSRGLEMKDLVTSVDPLYNRLIVFDPRLPHGVRPVSGTREPKQARLVLHGWFVEPTPFFTGPLGTDRDGEESEMDLERACGALNEGLAGLMEELAGLPPATGTLTARLSVSGATGRVDHVTWLTDTVVPVWAGARGDRGEDGTGTGDLRAEILGAACRHLSAIVFPATQQGESHVTVPIVFQ